MYNSKKKKKKNFERATYVSTQYEGNIHYLNYQNKWSNKNLSNTLTKKPKPARPFLVESISIIYIGTKTVLILVYGSLKEVIIISRMQCLWYARVVNFISRLHLNPDFSVSFTFYKSAYARSKLQDILMGFPRMKGSGNWIWLHFDRQGRICRVGPDLTNA